MRFIKCMYQGIVVSLSESLEGDAVVYKGVIFGIIREAGEPKYFFAPMKEDETYGSPMLIPINSVYVWPEAGMKEVLAIKGKGKKAGKILDLSDYR